MSNVSGRQKWLYRVLWLFICVLLFSGFEINIGKFEIKFIALDLAFINRNFLFIGKGLFQTLWIAIVSMAIALLIAIIGVWTRVQAKNVFINETVELYVSFLRGTPLLLQLFFFFLALPQLGVVLNGVQAGILTLSLNYSAYLMEIIRGGYESVSSGEVNAAKTLGLTDIQIFSYIIFPQAIRNVLPAFGNDFVYMIKDTALVSSTGYVQEILWRAQKVGQSNFKMFEALIIASIYYWVLTTLISSVQKRIEEKMKYD